jgi:hypothetical protein
MSCPPNSSKNLSKSSSVLMGWVCLVGGYHGLYEDNLCFFRCLAVHLGASDVKALEVPAKTYYHQYLQYRQMASKDLQRVCLDDLMVLEQFFQTQGRMQDFKLGGGRT